MEGPVIHWQQQQQQRRPSFGPLFGIVIPQANEVPVQGLLGNQAQPCGFLPSSPQSSKHLKVELSEHADEAAVGTFALRIILQATTATSWALLGRFSRMAGPAAPPERGRPRETRRALRTIAGSNNRGPSPTAPRPSLQPDIG